MKLCSTSYIPKLKSYHGDPMLIIHECSRIGNHLVTSKHVIAMTFFLHQYFHNKFKKQYKMMQLKNRWKPTFTRDTCIDTSNFKALYPNVKSTILSHKCMKIRERSHFSDLQFCLLVDHNDGSLLQAFNYQIKPQEHNYIVTKQSFHSQTNKKQSIRKQKLAQAHNQIS